MNKDSQSAPGGADMNTDLGQCMNYREDSRCPNPATGRLYHPDGQPNPGGWYCTECAASTVSEYLEKLGEAWSFTLGDYPPRRDPWVGEFDEPYTPEEVPK